jgi:ABC-type nitrate/sulfonate/bicarbonate transport system permease component
LAIFTTLGVGLVGAGGAGFYLMESMRSMEYGKLVQGILLLGGMTLVLDLILGFVEYKASFSTPSLPSMQDQNNIEV